MIPIPHELERQARLWTFIIYFIAAYAHVQNTTAGTPRNNTHFNEVGYGKEWKHIYCVVYGSTGRKAEQEVCREQKQQKFIRVYPRIAD